MSCAQSTEQDVEWARIFVWIANSFGLIYNIPQVIHTIHTKKTGDISSYFLIIRFISSSMWTFYAAYFLMYDVMISWIITLTSNMVIMYYKYIYEEPVPIQRIEPPQVIEQPTGPPEEYDIIILKDEH